MKPAIKIENLSKQYRLGVVGTGTLSHDLKRWWTMNIRGKEDPYLKIGETNTLTPQTPNPKPQTPNPQYIWALKDINLEINQGDVVGIIGKNGAGKSTLLKILSRVTKPTTGTIKYKGRIASLLEVGTGFHPEMTGRENIYMNGAIMGMTRHEITRKLDEIIAFAGIETYIDTPVKRYSSGMTVRLGFSIAAHLEPDILVVDEVLAVGDAEFQKKAIGKMQDVSKEGGRTVLFVSHNMAAVQNLCTRGIVVNDGVLTYDGIIDDAISKYLTFSQNIISKGLKNRTDRKGSGLLRFTKIYYKDKDSGEIINTIRSGQNLKIEICYETEIKDGQKVIFGIGVFTMNGSFLFASRSDSENNYLDIKKTKKTSCIINDLPLNQGMYKLNIIAYYKGETIDHIIDAGVLEVESADFFGNGKIPAGNRPGVLIKTKWE